MTPSKNKPPKTLQPLTPAVFHILLALNEGPAHGYGVLRAVARTAEGEAPMGPSTVYGTLDRLVNRGLVSVSISKRSSRKRYALTPEGHRALWHESARLARLASLVRHRNLVEE